MATRAIIYISPQPLNLRFFDGRQLQILQDLYRTPFTNFQFLKKFERYMITSITLDGRMTSHANFIALPCSWAHTKVE